MELRDCIRETLSLAEAQAPALTTTPPDPARQFAAAGLMRCCALLRGVVVLEDAGLGVLAGILERQHWETWLLSLYVLLRPNEALREVAGDHIKYKRLVSKGLDLKLPDEADWDLKLAKLNVQAIFDQIGALLREAGEQGDSTGPSGYDATYRVQSTFAAHANLSTIGAFIRYGDESWAVEKNPPPPFPSLGLTPALHTSHLARYVFKAFGIPSAQIDSIGDQLLAWAAAKNAERVPENGA